jgi:hypothetical protein
MSDDWLAPEEEPWDNPENLQKRIEELGEEIELLRGVYEQRKVQGKDVWRIGRDLVRKIDEYRVLEHQIEELKESSGEV